MNEFNKQNMTDLHKDIDAALKALGNKHGIILSTGTITYQPGKFTCRLTGLAGAGGEQGVDEYAKYSIHVRNPYYQTIYGVNEAMLNQVAVYGGERHIFIGLAPSKKKYPYVFKKEKSGKLIAYATEVGSLMLSMMAKDLKIEYTPPRGSMFASADVPPAPKV